MWCVAVKMLCLMRGCIIARGYVFGHLVIFSCFCFCFCFIQSLVPVMQRSNDSPVVDCTRTSVTLAVNPPLVANPLVCLRRMVLPNSTVCKSVSSRPGRIG